MLGVEIKNRRLSQGYSQKNLAKNLGISRATLQRWESGTTEPTASQVLSMAEFLEVSCDEILGFRTYPRHRKSLQEIDIQSIQGLFCNLVRTIGELCERCDSPEEVMDLLLDVGEDGRINHPKNEAFIDLLEALVPLAGEVLKAVKSDELA